MNALKTQMDILASRLVKMVFILGLLAYLMQSCGEKKKDDPTPTALDDEKGEELLELNYIFYDIPYQYHFIEGTSVVMGIQHFLEEHAADMLVMMPRRHGLIKSLFKKSITKHIALHTQIPLLALPH